MLTLDEKENMVIDSIHGFRASNSSVSIVHATEDTFRGYIEFMATNLRMYYAANEPPGTINVTGNYTVWRVGYRGQPIVLISLLPPLVLICGLAIYYLIVGTRSGSTNVPLPAFDPVDSLSILLAGAAGGTAGKVPVAPLNDNDHRDKKILHRMTLRFESDTGGYVVADGKRATVQEMELEPMPDTILPRAPSVHTTEAEFSDPGGRKSSGPLLQPLSPYQSRSGLSSQRDH